MRELLKKRILFFGGKGGVGKTTCASAVALAAAKAGKRVLVVSTDPAHSTSDIFERAFSREESEVYPGISGIEVDADFEARRYIETVKSQIARLFSPSILKEAERQNKIWTELPLEDFRKISPAFDADISVSLTVEAALSSKKVSGGTALDSVRAAIADLENRLPKEASAK